MPFIQRPDRSMISAWRERKKERYCRKKGNGEGVAEDNVDIQRAALRYKTAGQRIMMEAGAMPVNAWSTGRADTGIEWGEAKDEHSESWSDNDKIRAVLMRNDSGSSMTSSSTSTSSCSDLDSVFSPMSDTRRSSSASSFATEDEEKEGCPWRSDNMPTPTVEHGSVQLKYQTSDLTSTNNPSGQLSIPGRLAQQLDALMLRQRGTNNKSATDPGGKHNRRANSTTEGFPWCAKSENWSGRRPSIASGADALAATPSAIFYSPKAGEDAGSIDDVKPSDATATASAQLESPSDYFHFRRPRTSISHSYNNSGKPMLANIATTSTFRYDPAPFPPLSSISSSSSSSSSYNYPSTSSSDLFGSTRKSSSRPGTAFSSSPCSSRPSTSSGTAASSRPWVIDSEASSVRSAGAISSDNPLQETSHDTLSVMSPAAPPPVPCESELYILFNCQQTGSLFIQYSLVNRPTAAGLPYLRRCLPSGPFRRCRHSSRLHSREHYVSLAVVGLISDGLLLMIQRVT